MSEFRFCVAPMLDWTDRHERYFLRLLSRQARLYTEMVTTGALLYGNAARFLRFDPAEHPVAIQLGGSEPDALARCAALADAAGYDEVNLNVGCPSDRVQSGRFGACLMADPALVGQCVAAMQSASSRLVTVKSRIGIDEHDSDEFLIRFIETVAEHGCRHFILHARIAILKGLSPKENREVPPLNYARVMRMKARYPELTVVINGGITTLQAARELITGTAPYDDVVPLDGVMMGREAYQNPYVLSGVDQMLFPDLHEDLPDRMQKKLQLPLERKKILNAYLPYVARELAEGTPLQHMTRHILGLFRNVPGGRQFRRHLSENAHRTDAGISVLEDAAAMVR